MGLSRLGFDVVITDRQTRIYKDSPAILFGTTLWQGIEHSTGDWLLVDRASIGDPDYVSLVWNARGKVGDHKVPANYDGSRLEALNLDLHPLVDPGENVIICGEADGRYPDVKGTHFRPHPQGSHCSGLPTIREWIPGTYHVLRSSVAVEAVTRGYPVVAHDPSSMAHGMGDRGDWLRWLAWTQWRWDEIRQGEPIRHLFDGL